MCELLQDNGYTSRLLPDKALSSFVYPFGSGPCLDVNGNANDPSVYYNGLAGPANGQGPNNELLSAMLVVVSGSGSSSDAIMPNTFGVPIVIGENAILGSGDNGVPGGHGEHFLYYSKKTTGNVTTLGGDYQYMKVVDPNHPIMKGIPLVASTTDTNRTYIKDFEKAWTERTRAVLRVHTSNYRVVGFTAEPSMEELATLAASGIASLELGYEVRPRCDSTLCPFSRKWPATSTAWLSRPPGLSRRSSTSPSMRSSPRRRRFCSISRPV